MSELQSLLSEMKTSLDPASTQEVAKLIQIVEVLSEAVAFYADREMFIRPRCEYIGNGEYTEMGGLGDKARYATYKADEIAGEK